jgi:hypothetical protein
MLVGTYPVELMFDDAGCALYDFRNDLEDHLREWQKTHRIPKKSFDSLLQELHHMGVMHDLPDRIEED